MMISNYINIQRGDWLIRIYQEGGYMVSNRITINGDSLWVDACDDHDGIPDELVADAATCYQALHGKEWVW